VSCSIRAALLASDILELVYIPNHETAAKDEAGLFVFRDYLNRLEESSDWEDLQRSRLGLFWESLRSQVERFFCGETTDPKSRKAEGDPLFAPKPNLSLNVGIKTQPNWVFLVVAAVGFLLQSGVIALAGACVGFLAGILATPAQQPPETTHRSCSSQAPP
jgi:hypothetical protein